MLRVGGDRRGSRGRRKVATSVSGLRVPASVTETNRICLVLFDMNNRIFDPTWQP
jgi:hypothetical protein